MATSKKTHKPPYPRASNPASLFNRNPQQLNQLVRTAIEQYNNSKLDLSLVTVNQVLKINPREIAALNLRGVIYLQQLKFSDAVDTFKRIIDLKPDFCAAYNNLGVCYQKLGLWNNAIATFEKGHQLDLNDINCKNNLKDSVIRKQVDETSESHWLRQILYTKKSIIDFNSSNWLNMAVALRDKGQLKEACTYCEEAMDLGANDDITLNIYAHILGLLGQTKKAQETYAKAIAINPNNAELYYNSASLSLNKRDFDQAELYYKKAIELKPDYCSAYTNLGNTLIRKNQLLNGIACFDKAAELDPNSHYSFTSKLFNMNYLPDMTAAKLYQQALIVGQKMMAEATAPPYSYNESRFNHRPEKIKIAFVSADLRAHPVGYFLQSIVEQFDQTRFEWYAFHNHQTEDELSKALKEYMTSWHNVLGMKDKPLSDLIHQMGIDILIDLGGHTFGSRISMLAYKPAPIQVNWLGWFATTGLPTVDYLLADHASIPAGSEQFFSEKIAYLPATRLCMTRPTVNIEVAPAPIITKGHITLGCVQNTSKISDDVIALWVKLLQAIPSAQLYIQSLQFNNQLLRSQFSQRLVSAGLSQSQFKLVEPMARDLYLANFANMDMLLDTFPYPGGTTTVEALWMGVPTLTLSGKTMISMQGASLMTAGGLNDWVAKDPIDYVQKATYWANNPSLLNELRLGLRKQVSESPLFNAPLFANNFESALDAMWNDACRLSPSED